MKIVQNLIAGGAGFVAFIYLMLPSALPDFIPIVGALDEVLATTILIAAFSYFGLDVTRLFGRAQASHSETQEDAIDAEVVSREQVK